jgi:hypothetical protein
MPVVELPWDLGNTTQVITYTNHTPGVGAYVSSNGQDRADIYVGFVLDGYTEYRNISNPRPNIKIEFYEKPTISCQSTESFNPKYYTQFTIEVIFLVSAV